MTTFCQHGRVEREGCEACTARSGRWVEEPPRPPVASLATARAMRSGDATAWGPADALRYMLGEIDAGRIAPTKLIISAMQPAGSAEQPIIYTAGTTHENAILLLEITKAELLDEIRGIRR